MTWDGQKRKVIHVTANQSYLYALCDDGSIWFSSDNKTWTEVPLKGVTL